MLKRIWRSIVRFFQGLFGKKTPERTEPTESKPPLEDADYEFLFMQLLEGVHFGWGLVQVLNYLDNLSDFSGRPRTDFSGCGNLILPG
ncbi:MAG: hypothetical protein EBE86_004990 [Hormoscilla sp. GUM202]|nr:hypothetical protein [Hormoscilla sp. GUM202]